MSINGNGKSEEMTNPKDLYIITTARKRDTLEWEDECKPFQLFKDPSQSISNVKIEIDSWNNIKKYENVKDAFFLFDEQRVVGKGAWVKAFLKITKSNRWILLSATPGDTWSDYVPVFIANGFYNSRTDFERQHAVYSRYTKFPKIDHYVNTGKLIKYRKDILVDMKYHKPTVSHKMIINCDYNKELYSKVTKYRWNIFEDRPIKDVSEYCSVVKRLTFSDEDRIAKVRDLVLKNKRTIIFYNFNYEIDLLMKLCESIHIPHAQWNGHKHEPIPNTERWAYLVQYYAGAEGWNCTLTNVMIFYSQSYSYKSMIQAAGRIDRVNTSYTDLYYYHIRSNAPIDLAIARTLMKKQDFNESKFMSKEEFEDVHIHRSEEVSEMRKEFCKVYSKKL